MFRFADPQYLYLLLLLPLLVYWYWKQYPRGSGKIRFSDINIIKKVGKTTKQQLRHSLFALRILFLALLITAFARPQSSSKMHETSTEGIDIIMALDGHPTHTIAELLSYMDATKKVGETATLTVYRDGALTNVVVTLGQRA